MDLTRKGLKRKAQGDASATRNLFLLLSSLSCGPPPHHPTDLYISRRVSHFRHYHSCRGGARGCSRARLIRLAVLSAEYTRRPEATYIRFDHAEAFRVSFVSYTPPRQILHYIIVVLFFFFSLVASPFKGTLQYCKVVVVARGSLDFELRPMACNPFCTRDCVRVFT